MPHSERRHESRNRETAGPQIGVIAFGFLIPFSVKLHLAGSSLHIDVPVDISGRIDY